MTDTYQHSDGRDAGQKIGQSSTDKLGFYGETPIVQPSVTAIGTTTISQVGTTGKWAFATSTAALAFVARVRSIQDKLDALGLVAEG
jgi:hypothetical protein